MQVSVETTSGLERRMKVSIPAEEVEREVDRRLRSLTRTVKMKGFRPGKVPLSVISSQYGPQVRQEVLNELTQRSFREAVARENLQLASMPRIEPQRTEPGEDYEYSAIFEVVESFDIAPVKDIKITRPVAEITEEDVDAMVENLRRQRARWQAVEREAREGDRLLIDYRGTIDGEAFEGNEGKQVPIVLGSGQFIAGFEEQLKGARAGEDRVVEVTFPEDYHARDLAGRQARFDVHVHAVEESVLPEVDEEFVRSFDVPDGSVESLRAEVRRSMEDELAQVIRDRVREQVMDGLLAANPVQLPQAQVEEQINALMNQARENLQRQGVNVGDVELSREMFEEQARKRVALGMLTAEIVKQQNMVADPDKVRAKVESLAAAYEDPDEVMRWYYADRSRLNSVESLVLEDAVVDWVMEHAQVTDEPSSFEALMKGRGG
ncbi:MAG TPA: trigger factor [Gammaproteobacteria bacterium]|nr:trigger factor [Gammaproteobacteria bacterium]